MKPVKPNQEQMFSLIKEWEQSGMNKLEFCRIKNITKDSFYYWSNKYKKSQISGNGFLPVQVPETTRIQSSNIIIEYPSGIKLNLPSNYSVKQIHSLLKI